MTNRQSVALIIWFYLGWFGCIYFGQWQISNWSFVFPFLPMIYLYLSKLISTRQLVFLFASSLLGIGFDSAAYFFQLIQFPNQTATMIPTWLMAIWFLFATVFPLSHRVFKAKLILAAILGAVFGPLSYYSGEAFQALAFKSNQAIFIYAIFWGIYFPMMHYFYRKYV